MYSLNYFVRKVLSTVPVVNCLFAGVKPSETFKQLVRVLIPNISKNLSNNKKIDRCLQKTFFKRFKGLFRYQVAQKGGEVINFGDNANLQKCLNISKDTRHLTNVGFNPTVALILGSTIMNFCNRFTFLLLEMSKVKTNITKLGALAGNRIIPQRERDFFEELGFESSHEIVTEYDFAKAIIESRVNVEIMLNNAGLDPEKIAACLEAYMSVKTSGEIVCVNTIDKNNKPNTYWTIVDYIALGSNIENENIVVVSSQPFCDFQLLTTLRAFNNARKYPKNLNAIADGIKGKDISTKTFGDNTTKVLDTFLKIVGLKKDPDKKATYIKLHTTN